MKSQEFPVFVLECAFAVMFLLVVNIPWSHNLILIQKIKPPATRLWYAAKITEIGRSRHILILQIKSDLHKREGKATTNFKQTLPDPQSDLALQIIKDPYNKG